jgi:hypothetical protein
MVIKLPECGVPQCEQRTRSLQSGTVVVATRHIAPPFRPAPHDQPQMHRCGFAESHRKAGQIDAFLTDRA